MADISIFWFQSALYTVQVASTYSTQWPATSRRPTANWASQSVGCAPYSRRTCGDCCCCCWWWWMSDVTASGRRHADTHANELNKRFRRVVT